MQSRLLPQAPWLPIVMLVVSFLGFADASYLAAKHFTNGVIPCSLTHGCEAVTNSVYSEVLGIPVALLGSVFYVAIAVLLFASIESGSRRLLRLTGRLTLAGFLSSAWFVYAQLFLIHAICQWCMASALTSTILFVLGFMVLPQYMKKSEVVSE